MMRTVQSKQPNILAGPCRSFRFAAGGAIVAISMLISMLAGVGCSDPHGDRHRGRWLNPTGDAPKRRFSSTVEVPSTHLGMATKAQTIDGKAVRVACAYCHSQIKQRPAVAKNPELRTFHKAQIIAHGSLSCRSCHSGPHFKNFHLSNGETIEYPEVMRLCGQCHSRQLKDYRHGAHGGMTGYWDLDRGPRTRNHCLQCHNPHHPAIPKVIPAPLPQSRFQEG